MRKGAISCVKVRRRGFSWDEFETKLAESMNETPSSNVE